MKAALLAPSDERWLSTLSRCPHDFYHLPGYVELMARLEGGHPCAFLAEEGDCLLFLPLILRSVTIGDRPLAQCPEARDALSPYGYPGPLLKAGPLQRDREGFLDEAINSMKREMAGQGVCSGFVRLHPLLTSFQESLGRHGELIRHGETVVIDLSLSDEELWCQTRKGHKSEINKLKREGFSAEMDSSWRYLRTFARLYNETMGRVRAEDYYFFNEDYFLGLRDALADHVHLCVVKEGDDLAAGALFAECCGTVQYHLSASSRVHSRLPATKLIIDFVRSWAKKRGNKLFHLGGGVGGKADSLFAFKAGFSKRRATFATWRLVFDRRMYDAACQAWQDYAGALPDDLNGFFPAYRKPVEPSATRQEACTSKGTDAGSSDGKSDHLRRGWTRESHH